MYVCVYIYIYIYIYNMYLYNYCPASGGIYAGHFVDFSTSSVFEFYLMNQ